jgi:hypothetical protein
MRQTYLVKNAPKSIVRLCCLAKPDMKRYARSQRIVLAPGWSFHKGIVDEFPEIGKDICGTSTQFLSA